VKVVFLEEVPGTARIGDIKEVKPGFARNYLLPRKMAMPATPSIIKTVEQRAAREARLQEARDNDARALATRLEGVSFTITAKAGSTGKLFGSVGTTDIAARVGETLATEFERQNVMLAEPIKELGDYEVTVKLSRNVGVPVAVSVVGEDGTTMADIRAKAEGRTAPVAEASVDEAAGDQTVAEDESIADDGSAPFGDEASADAAAGEETGEAE
jgi:large subunit ribosomal protein L9